MSNYPASKSRYVTLHNLIGFDVGVAKNGKPIVAWVGKRVVPQMTFRDPVEINVGVDESGNEMIGYVTQAQYKELIGQQKVTPSVNGVAISGVWEKLVMETLLELAPKYRVVEFYLLPACLKKTSWEERGKKDRRPEYIKRAVKSLIAKGLLKEDDSLLIVQNDESDLIA